MQIWRASQKKDLRLYLGVRCKHCESPILFGLDQSQGHGRLRPCLTLVLTCSAEECGRQADYSDAPVSRYRRDEQPAGAVMVEDRSR
jgi:RNase P subunit RPR2